MNDLPKFSTTHAESRPVGQESGVLKGRARFGHVPRGYFWSLLVDAFDTNLFRGSLAIRKFCIHTPPFHACLEMRVIENAQYICYCTLEWRAMILTAHTFATRVL
jgi:hypothetical protein